MFQLTNFPAMTEIKPRPCSKLFFPLQHPLPRRNNCYSPGYMFTAKVQTIYISYLHELRHSQTELAILHAPSRLIHIWFKFHLEGERCFQIASSPERLLHVTAAWGERRESWMLEWSSAFQLGSGVGRALPGRF